MYGHAQVMPRQNPLSSSGPLPMVYALPSEGPYFPCAIKDDRGEQIPCDDGEVRACRARALPYSRHMGARSG